MGPIDPTTGFRVKQTPEQIAAAATDAAQDKLGAAVAAAANPTPPPAPPTNPQPPPTHPSGLLQKLLASVRAKAAAVADSQQGETLAQEIEQAAIDFINGQPWSLSDSATQDEPVLGKTWEITETVTIAGKVKPPPPAS